jgi:valyl-tRNA synthetase
MNEKLLKPYSPVETEPRVYSSWEESGLFDPDISLKKGFTSADAPTFTIAMPPPNVTGILHMGHAMMLTLEDIMVRFNRMRGKRTLWIPGTDHAAIATQSKVEKDIQKKEGKNRYEVGREELLKRIDIFAKESHDTIVSQIKVMGASCDWSREAFTLDEPRSLAVRTIFKKMYDDGLIYRGSRIVNWDPKLQTTVSDEELVYKEETVPFYYLKYGPFTIGTSRPETKFGDKYVVMHPDDPRYKKYKHGDKFDLEWLSGQITATVIMDDTIDMEFGTGVMTITPWHDLHDFEIAERHGLDKEQIIDLRGKLLPVAGEFAGLPISKARLSIIEKLKEKGLLEKVDEKYVHNVATSERSGGIIEPQILRQWFIDVNKSFVLKNSKINGITSGSETTLKEIMRKTVDSGQIDIIPEHFRKTYFHWIDNLRDWCVSRQIWYGHRIPVWYKPKTDGTDEIYCDTEAPDGSEWTQDEDTLDTWFSSGLWTFSTLGWPEKTKDLEIYSPTDVLETGYEILFFWVARMILMTGYALGDIPFKTVYLHGTVRDDSGKKMSKSLDNGIDPLDVAREFGSDAGRMALIVGTGPGMDSKISKDKIKAYKHFANKIWNATRFVLSNSDNADAANPPALTKTDQGHITQMEMTFHEVTKDIEEYRFHTAAEKLYHYFWHTFADIIIEESKKTLQNGSEEEKVSSKYTLFHILEQSLIMLHPFMPFITEEVWSMLPDRKRMLIVEPWPVENK